MSNQKNLFVFYENCKFIFFHNNDFFLLLKICILKSPRLILSVSSKCLSPSSFFHHLIFHIYSYIVVVLLLLFGVRIRQHRNIQMMENFLRPASVEWIIRALMFSFEIYSQIFNHEIGIYDT